MEATPRASYKRKVTREPSRILEVPDGWQLDQHCESVDWWNLLMPETIGPWYQEMPVGITGRLVAVELHGPLVEPNNYHGCGQNIEAKVSIMRWFEGWRENTPSELEGYIVRRKVITWECGRWNRAIFEPLGVTKGEKIVLFLDGETWCTKCPFGYDRCVIFMSGEGCPIPVQKQHGFWDSIHLVREWKTWPGERGQNMTFRSYVMPVPPVTVETILRVLGALSPLIAMGTVIGVQELKKAKVIP